MASNVWERGKKTKQGVLLSGVQLRTCLWKLGCVIFIDSRSEAGVSQSLEEKKRWKRSNSLSASQYLDFKAIDKLFLWGGKKKKPFLAYNPVCVGLRPSSSLFPVKRNCRRDFIRLPTKKEKSKIWCSFSLSCFFNFFCCLLVFHFLI